MRKFIGLLFLVALSFTVYSCLSENGSDLKKIDKKEAVFRDKHDSANLAVDLDQSYKVFIQKYPTDTNIPRMLFEDAQLNIYPLRRIPEAVRQLGDLYTKYPESKYSANALFKSAFLNESVLGRYDVAKSLYQKFIETYPTNSLCNDAKLSIENLGLSPDAQLKKMQAKQDSLKNATVANK